ncbi:hypothetical protein SAMN05421788_11678 [Filimonas lacunae]|uniref:Uncharacterized protein n=1 Tax=Filimonas lacunae TaxID=477680 RepID=A0A173MGU1_9BACT|nr:hypothetical protein [Filimonas lacunae]BAV06716.1 hypothetical protein FLA_2736 [Filimonas lacunae]SIT34469.1 hypothetical protein SAMN05421788_11678 [Filimonas lacunae]
MKFQTLKATFKLTDDFLYACNWTGKTPEQVLQQFADRVTIVGYLEKYNTSSSKLAGEFIKLCNWHLQIEKKLLKGNTIKYSMSSGFMQKIAKVIHSEKPQPEKALLYQQIIHDWKNAVLTL